MCPDVSEPQFRQPTGPELSLLTGLISSGFQGAVELMEQLATARVAPIDADGSLRLQPTTGTLAPVRRRIPVEATYADDDGVSVHVLIHVIDGLLDQLEIYREDSEPVLRPATQAPDLEIDE